MALRAPDRPWRVAAGRRLGLLAASLLAATLRPAPASAADFLDSYREGLAAVERADWAAAAERMRQAIAGKAEEDPRLARRLYLKRYTPHFYLGKALFELGDCAGALAAWAEAERQGVIQRFDEAKEIAPARATCQARQAAAAAAEEAVRRTRDQIGRAAAVERRIAELLAGSPELAAAGGEGSPALAARLGEASGMLEEAGRRLPAGGAPADPARVVEAGDLAAEARRRLETLVREAERLAAAAEVDRQASRGRLDALVESASTLLETTAYLEPFPPEVARRRREVEAARDKAATLPTATAAEGERAFEKLTEAVGRLRRATAPPPEGLTAAASAFFAGDYERAQALLADFDSGDARARAQACLFRAATRFALYLAGGETDAALLAQARRETQACRRADPAFGPPPGAFSPRFEEFFAGVPRE